MKDKRITKLLVGAVGLFLIFAVMPNVAYATSDQINYQGFLTDSGGAPVDGNKDMRFSIYQWVAEGSYWNLFWIEEHLNVPVNNGIFSVILGESNPILSIGGTSVLGVEIKYGATYEPMVPTGGSPPPGLPLTSAPFAISAQFVGGYNVIDSWNVQDETILSSDIKNGTIQNDDIDASANISASKINTSGLDADLLDGYNSTSFSLNGHWHNSLNASDGSPSNALYVDDAGEVGIGTTTPSVKLDVEGSSSGAIISGYNSNTVSGYGVWGEGETGIYGKASSGTGTYGVYGQSNSDVGSNFGYLGGTSYGAFGRYSSSGPYGYLGGSSYGTYGFSSSGVGVSGASTSGYGVYGYSTSGYAGFFLGNNDHYDLALGGSIGRINTDPSNENSYMILSSNGDVHIRLDNDGGESHVFRIYDSGSTNAFTVTEDGDVTMGNSTDDAHVFWGTLTSGSSSDSHRILPYSSNWGYIGDSTHYWYMMYTYYMKAYNYETLSSQEYKKNIQKLGRKEYHKMLNELMKIDTATYKIKEEYGGDKDKQTKLGFIAEELPEEVLSEDGKAVNIYSLLTYTIGAMKAQQEIIDVQQEAIDDLFVQLDELEESKKAEIESLKNQLSQLRSLVEKVMAQQSESKDSNNLLSMSR